MYLKKKTTTLFFIKGFISSEIVQIGHDCVAGNMRHRCANILVWDDSQQKGKLQTYILQGDPSIQFPPLVRHPDLPIKKILRRVLGLFTAMILKRVCDSNYFKSNKFTTCKVKDEKEMANSLMAFNLPKIIYPFQGKNHLRT